MASLSELREERLKKIELLREAGIEPYPAETSRSIDIDGFLADFETLRISKREETLAGRVMALRGQGGIMFADIFDGVGRMQVVMQKEEMDEALFDLFSKTVDVGDFIEVTGVAYLTKRETKSLLAKNWRMLSKSLRPLPDAWYGLEDAELKLRHREVDLLQNADLREMAVRRSKFWNTIRSFLLERGFVEVETPVLENSPGGADARPFITHHNALDIDVYLRISAGELWQKRLLVGGLPKVFEIGRIFRNEGQSHEHLQDYTQCEFYESFKSYREGMPMIRELYQRIAREVYGTTVFTIRGNEVDLGGEWETVDYCTAIKKAFGVDPLSCTETEALEAAMSHKIDMGDAPNKVRALDAMWKSLRKQIAGPAFLVGIPVFMEPLAKRSDTNNRVVERFQVILAGSEMGKGFSELNNPVDQRERFEEQEQLRAAGDDEAQRLDEEYLAAMEYGMPPALGFGVSERLFAYLENKSAHEAQLFPLLRPKL